MGKKSRMKRERREGAGVATGVKITPIKSPLDLPERTAFVLPSMTDIDDLDSAVVFHSFEDAVRAADDLGFDEVAQVNCMGPFVLGPSGKMWARQGVEWIEVPQASCEHHS